MWITPANQLRRIKDVFTLRPQGGDVSGKKRKSVREGPSKETEGTRDRREWLGESSVPETKRRKCFNKEGETRSHMLVG